MDPICSGLKGKFPALNLQVLFGFHSMMCCFDLNAAGLDSQILRTLNAVVEISENRKAA